MKPFALLAAALALAGTAAAVLAPESHPASRSRPPTTLSAAPSPVSAGHRVTFTGRHWRTGQSCDRQVALSVKAKLGQLGILVGYAHVRGDGSFSLRWRVPAGEASGPLRIVARENCAHQIERTVRLQIS